VRRTSSLGLALLASIVAGCAGSSTPAASPASPTASVPRPVSFTATDGVRLSGRLYGAGTTAVVLSNMGDNDPALWDAFAPALAARGYLVMTYSYRYPVNVSTFTGDLARHTVDDLRGAVAQLRAAGATRLVLAGDTVVPFANVQQMFTVAADPKELRRFGGSEHALHLFEGEHGKELGDALIVFITRRVPPA
jgi:hypothetical protein